MNNSQLLLFFAFLSCFLISSCEKEEVCTEIDWAGTYRVAKSCPEDFLSPATAVDGNLILELIDNGENRNSTLAARFEPDAGTSRILFDGFFIVGCSLRSNVLGSPTIRYNAELSEGIVKITETFSGVGPSRTCTYSGRKI